MQIIQQDVTTYSGIAQVQRHRAMRGEFEPARVSVLKDAKRDWLVSKVSNAEGSNDFAHSDQTALPTFTFEAALSSLKTFPARLPDPYA